MIYEPIPTPERYMVLLNLTGDTALTWDDPDDLEVLTFIEKKMNEGYVFFIEEPRFLKAFKRKKRLQDVNDIPDNRTVYMDDGEAARLNASGKLKIVKLQGEKLRGARKATSAKDVAANRSYATRPAHAG
jgi:hypothetical protein